MEEQEEAVLDPVAEDQVAVASEHARDALGNRGHHDNAPGRHHRPRNYCCETGKVDPAASQLERGAHERCWNQCGHSLKL